MQEAMTETKETEISDAERSKAQPAQHTGRAARSLRKILRRPCLLIPGFFLLLAVILETLAVYSRGFADWHARYAFPVLVNTMGRAADLVSFSVGEWMIVALVILIIVFLFVLGSFAAEKFLHRTITAGVRKFRRRFLVVMWWLAGFFGLLMVLSCFILYRATGYPLPRMTKEQATYVYGMQNLTFLRDTLVDNANRMSELVERDADGNMVYGGDFVELSREAMEKLGEQFPQLAGYYPHAKPLAFSDFACQAEMCGYYFPFSMEANYNTEMVPANFGFTVCHELAHLKGFLREDDCNMLAFLACIGSDDPSIVYSGILGVLNYVDNAWYDSIGHNEEIYFSHVNVKAQVREDNIYITEETRARVDAEFPWKREKVKKASDIFTETTLKANGVSSGIRSYSLVVRHLLCWFASITGIPESAGQ